jgi:hypothetical protein
MTIAVVWKPRTCMLSCSATGLNASFAHTHTHVPDAYLPKDVY